MPGDSAKPSASLLVAPGLSRALDDGLHARKRERYDDFEEVRWSVRKE
jgi:hypothetical protein